MRETGPRIKMDGGTEAPKGEGSPTEGWKYYYNQGIFLVNYDKPTQSDPSVNYDDL